MVLTLYLSSIDCWALSIFNCFKFGPIISYYNYTLYHSKRVCVTAIPEWFTCMLSYLKIKFSLFTTMYTRWGCQRLVVSLFSYSQSVLIVAKSLYFIIDTLFVPQTHLVIKQVFNVEAYYVPFTYL